MSDPNRNTVVDSYKADAGVGTLRCSPVTHHFRVPGRRPSV